MADEYLPLETIRRFWFTKYAATRVIADGVTATNTSLTSATAAFTSADVGATVTGAGIQGGTTISSVTNATTVVLSQATEATASGVSVTISRTTAAALAAFQAALLADWGPSGTISHRLPSTFQVLANSNAPTVAICVIGDEVIQVPRDSHLGRNYGAWTCLTTEQLNASFIKPTDV